ncbi:protein N-lysine methyltransferase METTL21D-like isoform X2 [Mya arenaria]|uniref:protein N-lysine methyltransferase METTL21D-like isoform X2 n=1 Tax=Mya arenaria TaxID=6604 RepID=UPI0022E91E36|nr:protein N-lysine methyltransferase METTL21D-like isoform X2 [Mya arenaria]
MKESNIFTRDLERNDDKVLKLKQYETGDVGCVVWDAAIVLAKYFEAADFQYGRFWKGKKVLELGSGTGAVGLLTASYGASTIITDLQDFVPLMNMNIETNKETFPDMDIKASALVFTAVTKKEPLTISQNCKGNFLSLSVKGLLLRRFLWKDKTPSFQVMIFIFYGFAKKTKHETFTLELPVYQQ